SPGLFAACHVLHRLSVPRHPPDALTSRLITGISRRNQGCPTRCRTTAAHRAKTLYTAASHEDTSSDRPWRKLGLRHPRRRSLASPKGARPKPSPASEPVRLGHITTLSLHPSINTRLPGTTPLKRISFFSEPRCLPRCRGQQLCWRYAERRSL